MVSDAFPFASRRVMLQDVPERLRNGLNDNDDELYTLSEMKRADEILQEVYKKAGAQDRYKSAYYPGPHKFDKQMQADAFAWFDRWLKA
jgi:hypothetical protein